MIQPLSVADGFNPERSSINKILLDGMQQPFRIAVCFITLTLDNIK